MSELNEVRLDAIEIRLNVDEVKLAVEQWARSLVYGKVYNGHAFVMKDSYDGYGVWILRGEKS